MSVNDWHIGGGISFNGLANYGRMLTDERFGLAVLRTLYFTALAVLLPMVLGVAAAVTFAREFPGRGLARTVFILPMMATPVAIALVWTMMFHPQLGVLNYLLTSVGLPPSEWVYSANTVIPTLVMVETWQWTPLVMLIVLGGLASLPQDPYEAADLDGASAWQAFLARHPAAGVALYPGGGGDTLHGRAEGVRHHLRHQQRRAGHGKRDAEHPAVLAGVQLLRHGIRLGGRGGVLRAGPPHHAADALDPAADGAVTRRLVRRLRAASIAVTACNAAGQGQQGPET